MLAPVGVKDKSDILGRKLPTMKIKCMTMLTLYFRRLTDPSADRKQRSIQNSMKLININVFREHFR